MRVKTIEYRLLLPFLIFLLLASRVESKPTPQDAQTKELDAMIDKIASEYFQDANYQSALAKSLSPMGYTPFVEVQEPVIVSRLNKGIL
jgi:hypothetical protein